MDALLEEADAVALALSYRATRIGREADRIEMQHDVEASSLRDEETLLAQAAIVIQTLAKKIK